MSFFNREQIIIVRKVLQKGSCYNYWISKTDDGAIIDKRFLRQENFLHSKTNSHKMDPIFIYYRNLKFADNKKFALTCFIEIENDITELT